MCYTLDEIRDAVSSVAVEYNSAAPDDARISQRLPVRELCQRLSR